MTPYSPNSSFMNSIKVWGDSGIIRKGRIGVPPCYLLHMCPLRSECLDRSAGHVSLIHPFKFSSHLVRKKRLIPSWILWEKNKVAPPNSLKIFLKFIYYGCAGSSLLHGLFSSFSELGILSGCHAPASHCSGSSCSGAQTLGWSGFCNCGRWALACWHSSCGMQA